jgi:squalene-hopene/tetraprenyl-beta-curcumene cyclase
MKLVRVGIVVLSIGASMRGLSAQPSPVPSAPSSWNARSAAAYLDGRMAWWLTWPTASRDHETSCISCHTALPYALARPALRSVLSEPDMPAQERRMLDNVANRVRLWKDVDPFYPDQTRGLPKTSESRGTEAVLNALILASRDARSGALGDDARLAFANMWALQFRAGDQKGAWAWLNYHNEPWEANGSPYFGAALAAIAIGRAPGGYASTPEIQDRIKLLRDYLQRGADTVNLFNRVMGLWASTQLPDAVTPAQRQAIIDATISKQQSDGGWSVASLGSWKRYDGAPLDEKTDGLATGLIVYVLQSAGVTRADPHVSDGLAWLVQHQDAATGMWSASSLNKSRDNATDTGKFMSDAATAYAVLALTLAR